jgi:hypothetical protein
LKSDRIAVSYHGIRALRISIRSHTLTRNGVFYNGYSPNADEVIKNRHQKNSIHNVKNGIVTRGVLIDIHHGSRAFRISSRGHPIYIEDLEAWEKQAGVRVSSG